MSDPTRVLPSRPARTSLVLLVLALLIGGVLRFYHLSHSPAGLHPDETMYAYEGWSIRETGCDMRLTGCPPRYLQGYSTTWDNRTSVLYPYMFSLLWRIAPMNDFWLRFPSAVFGLLTVLMIYLLGRQFFPAHPVAAGWAALFVAAAPSAVIASRVGHDPVTVPFFSMVIIYSILRAQQQRWWYGLAFVTLALGLYSYQPFKVIGPGVCVLSLWYTWPALTKQHLRRIIVAAIVGLIIAAPFLYTQLLSWSIVQRQFSLISIFRMPHPETRVLYQFLVIPLAYLVPAFTLSIVLPLGIFAALGRQLKKRPLGFLLLWLGIACIPMLVTLWSPLHYTWLSRSLGFLGPVELLAGFGLALFVSRFQGWLNAKIWQKVIAPGIIGLIVLASAGVSGLTNWLTNTSAEPQTSNMDTAVAFLQQPKYAQRQVAVDVLFFAQPLQVLWYAHVSPRNVQAQSAQLLNSGSSGMYAQFPAHAGRFDFCEDNSCFKPNDGKLYVVPIDMFPTLRPLTTFLVQFNGDIQPWKIVDNTHRTASLAD